MVKLFLACERRILAVFSGNLRGESFGRSDEVLDA
jgi:hypothetical protein